MKVKVNVAEDNFSLEVVLSCLILGVDTGIDVAFSEAPIDSPSVVNLGFSSCSLRPREIHDSNRAFRTGRGIEKIISLPEDNTCSGFHLYQDLENILRDIWAKKAFSKEKRLLNGIDFLLYVLGKSEEIDKKIFINPSSNVRLAKYRRESFRLP